MAYYHDNNVLIYATLIGICLGVRAGTSFSLKQVLDIAGGPCNCRPIDISLIL